MILRSIRAGDRPSLARILAKSFKPDEVAVALELIDLAIARAEGSEDHDDYEALVAAGVGAAPGTIGGYICFGPTPMTRGTYDLYWIVTHPEARGRGVARALIEAMEAALAARGATAIRVETSESEGYGSARRLYERLGYPQAALLPDFYAPGDGLIIYYKRL